MCCILIVNKVVVAFRYGVGLMALKNGRFITSQYTSNIHVNNKQLVKQLVNSKN